MPRLLSSPHDKGLSIVLHSPDINYAAAVVVWSKHGFIWPYKKHAAAVILVS